MINFNTRIKKLKQDIENLPPLVKVTYKDGTTSITANGEAAINAIFDSTAIKVERIGKSDGSRWIEILQAIIDEDLKEAKGA